MRLHEPVWLYALLIVPAAMALSFWGVKKGLAAAEKFLSPHTVSRLFPARLAVARKMRIFALSTALTLIVISLARPQYGVKPVQITRAGIDIIVALDVSKSMATRDVKPDRITQAKNEISRLFSELEGNRMGLVAFAGRSFLECPLTTDVPALRMFLDSLDTGSIPFPGTAIAQVINDSAKAFTTSKAKTRALILVTDGEDLAGGVDEAIKTAESAGMRIYAIGVGSEAGAPVPEIDRDGNVRGYKTDESGATVISRLDAQTLRKIAENTGGGFYASQGETLNLDELISSLKRLEKTDITSQEFTEYEERYQPLAAAALILLLLDYFLFARLTAPSSARERAASTKSAV